MDMGVIVLVMCAVFIIVVGGVLLKDVFKSKGKREKSKKDTKRDSQWSDYHTI